MMKAWLVATSIFGLAALGLAAGASAQDDIVVDCNIFFQNNPTNCEAGDGEAAPPLPFTTCQLINSIFTNNQFVDPELVDEFNSLTPDFRAIAGGNSTHLGGGPVAVVPNDGFFTQPYFVGGVGAGQDEDWTEPWCYYSPDGAGRVDLPPGPPVFVSGNIAGNTTWTDNGLGYLLQGTVRVLAPAVLTIEPGTVIFGENATIGTLIIEQGARIMAQGTPTNPIIFTSDGLPGSQARGQWGGVVLNGRAPVNCAAVPGGTCEGEGGSGTYGGNLPNDSSGTLRYVRIEFAGHEFSPDNELNALTMNGVGSGTVIEFVQCHRGEDDGFEWFGGTVNNRNIVATDCADDEMDWQVGWRGKLQYGVARPASDRSDKGIEADNYEFGFDNTPRSNPTVSNLTLIGPGAAAPAGTFGIHLRRGTAGTIINSIVTNFRGPGIDLDDTATFNNGTGTAPILLSSQIGIADPQPAAARPLVVRQHPNPFNPATRFEFLLSQPGVARIDVYDGNGRHIDQLETEELAAGAHSISWSAPAGSPSGTYFYRMESASGLATGKMNLVK
jgi:hypothetical protein